MPLPTPIFFKQMSVCQVGATKKVQSTRAKSVTCVWFSVEKTTKSVTCVWFSVKKTTKSATCVWFNVKKTTKSVTCVWFNVEKTTKSVTSIWFNVKKTTKSVTCVWFNVRTTTTESVVCASCNNQEQSTRVKSVRSALRTIVETISLCQECDVCNNKKQERDVR